MSALPERKLKQARLSFNTTPPSKKRKHDDEAHDSDVIKFRKTLDSHELEQNQTPSASEGVNTEEDETSTENKQNVTSVHTIKTTKSKLDRFLVQREKKSVPEVENMDVSVTDNLSWESKTKSVPEIYDAGEAMKVPENSIVKFAQKKDVIALDTAASNTETTSLTSVSDNDTSLNNSELASGNADLNKSLDSLLKKKITPKQLLKKQEAEARRLERERIKKEKEQKRQEEKEAKERKRLAEIEAKNEEKRQKEEEKRIKEEKRKAEEEEKRRLKEEERKAKEEERKAKEEERKAKEEERKAKEEERRLKIEEKMKKEEQEKKNKEKISAAFTNFFLPKNKSTQPKTTLENVDKPVISRFMPFEVKADMKLADMNRATLTPERKSYLDRILEENAEFDLNSLYLSQLKSNDYKPGYSDDTWPLNPNDDDDDLKNDGTPGNDVRTRFRGKLFQFSENRRPAYWGTWRKRSKAISGRTPFKCDSEFFEYDIDSDEEWVEEPGESLHGSDDEKESDHEYEVDNDFFVPHGYLSDEEAHNDDAKDTSLETQKIKLNILEKEFEAELNEKTHKLKSRHYGCLWIPNSVDRNEGADDVENLLLSFRAVWNDEQTPFCLKPESQSPSAQSTPSTKTKMLCEIPEQFVPDLIKLVHGNKNSRKNLADEFVSYVLNKDPSLNLTSLCVRKKMKEISSWQVTACCWYVNDDFIASYNLNELSPSKNNWTYVSTACTPTPIRKGQKQNEKQVSVDPPVQVITTPVPKHNSIAKFVKVLTPEEKERQLKAAAVEKKLESTTSGVSPLATTEQKREDNQEEEKPLKKRAVLTNKDGVWTWNTGNKGSLKANKSSGEDVTVSESSVAVECRDDAPKSNVLSTSNNTVAVNDENSTIKTSAANVDEKTNNEKSFEFGDTLTDSKSASIVSPLATTEQKRKDNSEERKPMKKRAVLLSAKKDGVWTWNTTSSSNTAVTVCQTDGKDDSKVSKSSDKNVTAAESEIAMDFEDVASIANVTATSNSGVAVNRASSTIETSTADDEKNKKSFRSSDTRSDSKSASNNSDGGERKETVASEEPTVPGEPTVTIKQGKKYATLSTIGKLRD